MIKINSEGSGEYMKRWKIARDLIQNEYENYVKKCEKILENLK